MIPLLYTQDGFLVPNKLKRYAIGSRDKLKPNPDGSTSIYVQPGSPGAGKEANWLPAPAEGELSLMLRLYSPGPAVLDGSWKPPPAVKAA